MSPKRGLKQQLALAVFLSVLLAALGISATLFIFSQKRSYRDTVRRSEEMVQAAALAFSQALAAGNEVLLDALVHELTSRKELNIEEAYVLKPDGLVVAHSNLDEYGKTYPTPGLLKEEQPQRLSEVLTAERNSFKVLSLLQNEARSIGMLVVTFSTQHLSQEIQSEMLWIVSVTVPILILAGVGVMLYGRRTVDRLNRLQMKALAIGRGELGEPMEVRGSDEISQLTDAFNQMLSDLVELREKDRSSAETIHALNRDLSAQLKRVEQLKEQLAEENAGLREELRSKYSPGEIIGFNGGLRHVAEQVRQLASLPVTVLITGESGTGKELLARYLHEAGSRCEGAMIAVNCAALPVTLVESELFGHERGAFTDAVSQKKGKFELAHGGTLFLDEVGELPHEAQAKLLRALQDGEISRVGGTRPISVDVRLIAATNRNLAEDVKLGRFREDLYYRLRVVEIQCPPLRDRLEDLPALTQHFVEHYSRKLAKPVIGISQSALDDLASYPWPGNIRELENMIARAVALATTQVLGPDDFLFLQPPKLPARAASDRTDSSSPFESLLNLCAVSPHDLKADGWEKLLMACERICLEAVMENSKTQKEAAEALGLTPTKLHRLLKKHGLINRGLSSE